MGKLQIVHVEGKKNVVADALSCKPQVSAVSISYHNELEEMKGQYAEDEDFARIYDQIVNGQRHVHNNTVHTSTGKGPFEIVEGGKKVPPILQTKDKIFEENEYVQNTDEAYKKIKLVLEKTLSKQKKAADCHRRELVFSLGDWVLLRFEKARLRKMKGKERLFPKLGVRYYGPFQVCDKINDVAYTLKVPEGGKIHNAFHVSLLRPFVGDVLEDMVSEEQLEVEESDEILLLEQTLAHKDRKVRGKVARHYLVKFKNYSRYCNCILRLSNCNPQ
ncbi:hypothetical protein L7F22_027569 [Adiantum nelumboides]|nr:hypothetical protein [Adiantum nelumboides]